ncbi:ATP-binding protein [Deinococcus deserti]|uniref:histidine kinase n=2 Tax=Deinococcus TaxID=1298 RepID=C1D3Y2_DEIDV|nr:putative histidine kinase, classic [Deinococcus deserti VCD115]
MGALMREVDWSSTSLGPPDHWSPRLRTYIELMLTSKQPMYVGWTHDLIAIYNDAYRPILGADKHPGALGRRTADIFEHDGYPGLKPYFDAVLERGEGVAFVDILVPLFRDGYLEECYFDVSYTPIHGETHVEGMLASVSETTERVLSIRRTETLAALASGLLGSSDLSQIASAIVQGELNNPHDLPFTLLYLPDAQELRLQAAAGLDAALLDTFAVLPEAWRGGAEVRVESISPLTVGPWPEPVTQVAILPLAQESTAAANPGVLVIGLNARKRFDRPYRDYLNLLRGQVMGALRTADLTAVLQEQNAELDARTRILEAFATLTHDLGILSDPLHLIHETQQVILGLLAPGFSQYYEPEDARWVVRSQVGQPGNPEVQTALHAGLPLHEAPALSVPWSTGELYFQTAVGPAAGDLTGDEAPHRATASLPITVGGHRRGVLSFALTPDQGWSRSDRALLATAMRSLNLMLERVDQTHALAARQAEVESRNQALEAFAQLSMDLVVETDRVALIRRAQQIVLSLLPGGYAAYYELEEGRWRAKSQVGEIGDEGLQTLIDAGFAHDVPSLATPLITDEPFYQDAYVHGSDSPKEMVQHIQAVATLPLRMQGVTVGMFVIALFHQRAWTAVDRALLETTMRSLSLALERADFTQQLTEHRDALNARTQALGEANKELESFAYSVSHDLRTPVRHIAGFTSLLRKALDTPLDPKVARYLTVIEQSAQRMNNLIDAMLDLSRSARQPLQIQLIDLGALLTDVRAELLPDLRGRDISWLVDPLPKVWADQALMRQVLLNLISNALKYTRTREHAVIEVRAEERPEFTVLTVQDNGVGFDARYADKLFGVFQRLHLQEEFEGTGVGLANVRRIMARHGGQAWAKGAVGEGAAFSVSLPRTGPLQPPP